MSWDKTYAAHRRQEKILDMVSKPGGASSARMAEALNISRGQVIREIRELRKQGHPIQASSMVTEMGMYVAVFELMNGPKKLKKSTHAASAG